MRKSESLLGTVVVGVHLLVAGSGFAVGVHRAAGEPQDGEAPQGHRPA